MYLIRDKKNPTFYINWTDVFGITNDILYTFYSNEDDDGECWCELDEGPCIWDSLDECKKDLEELDNPDYCIVELTLREI